MSQGPLATVVSSRPVLASPRAAAGAAYQLNGPVPKPSLLRLYSFAEPVTSFSPRLGLLFSMDTLPFSSILNPAQWDCFDGP